MNFAEGVREAIRLELKLPYFIIQLLIGLLYIFSICIHNVQFMTNNAMQLIISKGLYLINLNYN